MSLPVVPLPWHLAEKCQAKRVEQKNLIPKEWLINAPPDTMLDVIGLPGTYGILTPLEIEITELDDCGELLRRLATGAWTSVAVVTAFCKRAIIAHQLTNCLTEFWVEDAILQAKELDKAMARSGPVGPLHGLPISLKDQFHVAGKETNMGIASWLGHTYQEDSALVKVLRKAGAVIYTRTNVPITLLMAETVNHVYGRTVNPRNRSLTCGGSSGGEGALVAMRGSPLGIGTDIGGSIRIPSTMNGLYGFRPTQRRIPYWGASNTLIGQEAIESSIGPISRSLSGCVSLFRVIVDSEPSSFDPKSVEIPWREDAFQLKHKGGRDAKMCFGYFEDDGSVRCHPPVRRAVMETIEALRARGHEVVEWKPLEHEAGISILDRIFASGGREEFQKIFDSTGEPIGFSGMQNVMGFQEITVNRYWQACQEKDAYRMRYLGAWLDSIAQTSTGRPIDGIICPVTPYPAVPHGNFCYAGYTQIFNLLDLPSVTIPVTTVDPALDLPELGYNPRSSTDREVYNMYDSPDTFKDSPIGVQVVGRRWREEECLGLASIVDEALSELLSMRTTHQK